MYDGDTADDPVVSFEPHLPSDADIQPTVDEHPLDDRTNESEPPPEPEPEPEPDPEPTADPLPTPGAHVEMQINGGAYDAGEISVDVDGDGQLDSAVITGPDQVEYYTDSDADGVADELTITTHDGALISHTERVVGTDEWQETLHVDQAPTAVTDPPLPHVEMTIDGTTYDAGEVSLDRDGDGHADTAIITSAEQIEYYTDTDGDGAADELTITTHDGALISHTERVPGTDTWRETAVDQELPDR